MFDLVLVLRVNRIVRVLRSNRVTHANQYATKAKGERLEQCLGGLLRCISVCCSSQGGKEIKNQGEMKDFASNLVRGEGCSCVSSSSWL